MKANWRVWQGLEANLTWGLSRFSSDGPQDLFLAFISRGLQRFLVSGRLSSKYMLACQIDQNISSEFFGCVAGA